MHFFETLEPRLQLASAGAGTLDTTFASEPAALATLLGPGEWRMQASGLALDGGGRAYALARVEEQSPDGPEKFVIARFTRDGAVDATFNGSGMKLLDPQPPSGQSNWLPPFAVDQNNRTYIVDGTVVWRLTPGGRVDRTFGLRGKVAVPILTDAEAIAFDANGRAYVGGTSKGKTGTRMTVVRLNDDGSHDATLGYQGAYKSPVHQNLTKTAGSTSTVTHLRVLDNGQLAVVGTFDYEDSYFDTPGFVERRRSRGTWATRLNANGDVDTSYGYREEVYQSVDVAWGGAEPIAIGGDGAVYGVVSVMTDARQGDVDRYGWNFRFGPDGQQVSPFAIAPPLLDELYDIEEIRGPIAIQADGKIIAWTLKGMFRSNGDGTTIDTTWGDDGFSEFPAAGNQFALAPDGSVILLHGGPYLEPPTLFVRRLWRDDGPLGHFDSRHVIRPRTAAHRFSVTWRDDDGVDPASFDHADLRVFGPFDGVAGASRRASFETFEALGGGRYRATYRVTSPDGAWNKKDNGTYSVRLLADQVNDVNGVAAHAKTMGTFRVRIT